MRTREPRAQSTRARLLSTTTAYLNYPASTLSREPSRSPNPTGHDATTTAQAQAFASTITAREPWPHFQHPRALTPSLPPTRPRREVTMEHGYALSHESLLSRARSSAYRTTWRARRFVNPTTHDR
ncbi:hypothetical protein D9619_013536 [Psilocybe cf. subviscida]|uniref:Uncharacterized protein n=1 Tax=Psilocybe cf. subviscida TaxID=2480587 RepID=A0A8H5BH66_9AGAR|nr:hypothetical protein D9619_013536 [Psilocybe cf. subviscida]